jgi:hypothetical protein
MSNMPIPNNPSAVGETAATGASLINKAIDLFTGKKSRRDEFHDSVETHKAVLEHHAQEAQKDREHQKELISHVVTTMAGNAGTLKSNGSSIEYTSPGKSSPTRATSGTTTKKASETVLMSSGPDTRKKQTPAKAAPKTTAPKAVKEPAVKPVKKEVKKTTPSAESVKARKGK